MGVKNQMSHLRMRRKICVFWVIFPEFWIYAKGLCLVTADTKIVFIKKFSHSKLIPLIFLHWIEFTVAQKVTLIFKNACLFVIKCSTSEYDRARSCSEASQKAAPTPWLIPKRGLRFVIDCKEYKLFLRQNRGHLEFRTDLDTFGGCRINGNGGWDAWSRIQHHSTLHPPREISSLGFSHISLAGADPRRAAIKLERDEWMEPCVFRAGALLLSRLIRTTS